MATPIVVAGMEQATSAGLATGNNTNKYFDRTAGTVVTNFDVTSGAARTGNAGLVLSASAGTAHVGFANSGNGGILGAAGTLVASFWFRIPSFPAANAIIWQNIGTAGGNDAFLRFIQASSRLQGEFGASTSAGPVITANTWHHVDVLTVHDANPHVMRWRVNGVEQPDIKLAVASENIFVMGWGNDAGSQTSTFHVDDIVVSLTAADYPLGPHRVIQLIPDTTATATQIGTADVTGRMQSNTTVDATFNSADILAATSEVPPTLGGSASGVGQDTIATTSAAEIPMTNYSLANEAVTGVRINVCTWANSATAAANTLGVRAFNGLAETTLFAAAAYGGVNTTTPAWICKMYSGVTNQQTLSNLTVRIGYSGDVTPLPGAHTIYAEVALRTAEYALPANPHHPGRSPARGQMFQQSQDDWLSRQVTAVTPPGASGNALAEQRSQTAATGTRAATGAASAAQRSTVVSTGFKSVTAAAQEQQRTNTRAVSLKGGTGAAQVQQRNTDLTTTRKNATGTAAATAHPLDVATGTKTGTGAALAQAHSETAAGTTAAKNAIVEQRSATAATGAKAASAGTTTAGRTATVSTGVKGAAGSAMAPQRSRTLAAGTKGATGSAAVPQRNRDAAAGAKGATGATTASQRSVDATAGTKAAAGAAQVQQRNAAAASSQPVRGTSSQQRSAVVASGAKGGVASPTVTCRTSTANAGNRTGTGAGTLTQRSTGAAAGRRSGAGAGLVQQRTAGTSAVRRGATGGARVDQRTAVTPVSGKGGRGVAQVQQRTHTLNVQFGPLTDLRIRISGREPPAAVAGREPPAAATGREPTSGISGREPPTSYAGRESTTTLAGREEGTP